jgi:hypothetical protein
VVQDTELARQVSVTDGAEVVEVIAGGRELNVDVVLKTLDVVSVERQLATVEVKVVQPSESFRSMTTGHSTHVLTQGSRGKDDVLDVVGSANVEVADAVAGELVTMLCEIELGRCGTVDVVRFVGIGRLLMSQPDTEVK